MRLVVVLLSMTSLLSTNIAQVTTHIGCSHISIVAISLICSQSELFANMMCIAYLLTSTTTRFASVSASGMLQPLQTL